MMVVGQLGTKSKKRTLWHPENLAPGQFGTVQFGIWTIWHQDNSALDNLAPGQFGTKHLI